MSVEHFKEIKCLGRGSYGSCMLVEVLDANTRSLCIKYQFDCFKSFTDENGEKYKNVAVIKIPNNLEAQELLQQEIGNLKRVRSKIGNTKASNILTYLCSSTHDRYIVLVTEYAEQGDLRKKMGKIGEQRKFGIEETLVILKGILNGLIKIHDMGLIHRDIKPENILFSDDVPLIADWGCSTVLHNNQLAMSAVAGTPLYNSPEIYTNKGANNLSDIWSLGVIFYEMMTGNIPWGNELVLDNDSHSIRLKICKAEFNPIKDLIIGYADDNVIENIDYIINKMLLLERDKRPDAKKIMEMLENIYDMKFEDKHVIDKKIKRTPVIVDKGVIDKVEVSVEIPGEAQILIDKGDEIVDFDPKKALEYYEKSIEINGNFQVFYNAADACLKLARTIGDIKESKTLIDKAQKYSDAAKKFKNNNAISLLDSSIKKELSKYREAELNR